MDADLQSTLRAAGEGGGSVLVMTGAGISAESGIPTFRGKEGYWTVGSRNYHPQELATAAAFSRMPEEVWRWYLFRRSVCRNAEPNPGHRALVRLEQALGDRFRLVTQNVDGLHLRAGHTPARLFEIHGNIDHMRCARGCSTERWPVPSELDARDEDAPLSEAERALLRCPACSGPARPHVLWFDEYYDEPLFYFESSLRAAERASLLVVVGSSGATNLPLQIATTVARRGHPIVDVNPEDNVFSELAEHSGGHRVRGSAARHLPDLVSAILGG